MNAKRAAALAAAASVLTALTVTSAPQATTASGPAASYVVLATDGTSAQALAATLTDAGAAVTSRNDDIGTVAVTSTDPAFRINAARLHGVAGVARDRSIGYATAVPERVVLKPAAPARTAAATRTDPLDSKLWGMRMVRAPQAHAVRIGSHKVRVGVIDTGIWAAHPDLRANVLTGISRNFVTDIPSIDGPCEVPSCKDPIGSDQGGHGTHVAGTIAAALNGYGVSGVAPGVALVDLRAGQDSGYFFLQPVVNALTYAANHGIDVVNMSFYVDPWLYNCLGGAPEDSPSEGAEQSTIIEAMRKAMAFAREHGVTLVAAAGNEHTNLGNPGIDRTSPDFPVGTEHDRTLSNASCFNLPAEGTNVITVSSLGPSEKKADYSNYTSRVTSGEIDVSAPGGWHRDGFGTPKYQTNGQLILSTGSRQALQDDGFVNGAGNVTLTGLAAGVIKNCPAHRPAGAAACGFYYYLQGTSMASPHVAGVAALAVAAEGRMRPGGFGLAPKIVRSLVYSTARDHSCPAGRVQSYTNEGRDSSWTATCVGSATRNGFYGWGIVNAFAVARK